MTKNSVLTRAGEINPVHSQIIIAAFAAFLETLPGLIAAERDLDGYDSQDPAFSAWVVEAEQARSKTSAALSTLTKTSPASHLKRLVKAFETALSCDDMQAIRHLRQSCRYHPTSFMLDAKTQHDLQINSMIETSLGFLIAFLDLDEHASTPALAHKSGSTPDLPKAA
jgi:hypothetical protein